ncbi:MAG: recombinase family protein [Ketobacter sp.]|nr:recombinase family protein [Ketobacter sp.]
MKQEKIQATHLKRKAVIYIRQSSLRQVEQHQESRQRQYQLVEQAKAKGWPEAQCEVIDEDLGISGAQSHNRPGYQRLISMLALREVGIVFGLEVSRLARNSLDMYQLLELAAAFDVLIADEDGLYEPADFNDRLLLGLKGTISEVELYQIRARLGRGKLHKAKRGALKQRQPIGLDWDPLAEKPRLAVDQSVRHAVARVFELFSKLRSVRSVLRHLRKTGEELPFQRFYRGLEREIGWRRPCYDAIYGILTNPTYAGVFCYGKRKKVYDPVNQTYHVRNRPREEWAVFLENHHPGYISLETFEENLKTIANNRPQFEDSQGAARRGPTLLQGLVYCQHCGHKMRVRYSNSTPYYTCDAAHRRFGDPICNRASAKRVDALVAELFLEVINGDTLAMSLAFEEQLGDETAQAERGWQEKLQRLEYEANLARRRYELVDPENRLVAQTLETEWDQKLLTLEKTRQDYRTQRHTAYERQSTLAQMQTVVSQLRDIWDQDQVSMQDKKELLRCLIEKVFLENQGRLIRTQVCWYGGATSELDVPKYLFSSPHLYHKITQFAKAHTDREIAALLNQEGLTTVKGRPWSSRRVMDFRLSNAIPSGFTTNVDLRIPDTGFITSAEAAKQLGISQTTVQKWYRYGLLPGKHDGAQAPLWIRWSEDLGARLTGGATPDPRMVSVRSLCKQMDKTRKEVYTWALENNHPIYRLRRGTLMRFYVLPQQISPPLE